MTFLSRLHTQPSYTFFFFNDTATTEIYTLSLHDALPIFDAYLGKGKVYLDLRHYNDSLDAYKQATNIAPNRSEEHKSELQSQSNLVCRLLLEKKKTTPPTAQCSSTP